jgi:hypothetical protein
MLSIVYNTERCLDGLELVDGYFRPRSERREPVHVVTADLNDLVVLQFVNARDADALLHFISKYSAGDLYTSTDPPKTRFTPNVSAAELADMQNYLRQKLASSDQVEALVSLSEPQIETKAAFFLRDGEAQMLLRCHHLLDFMRMEVAMIAVEGVKLVTCGHCRNYFLTGRPASRRTDTQHCSDRCRVAAMRARKKESEYVNTQKDVGK